jgi:hypothetical protein
MISWGAQGGAGGICLTRTYTVTAQNITRFKETQEDNCFCYGYYSTDIMLDIEVYHWITIPVLSIRRNYLKKNYWILLPSKCEFAY